MANPARPSALRFIASVLAVGLALFLTLQVTLLAERTPFALFFAAVMVSTWYGGRNPGLLAIALSALVSDYFIIPPYNTLPPNLENVFEISTFILVALVINSLTAALSRSEKSLRESEERYRLLFERNPLPMWVYDLETLAFLAVNEAAVQCYGYSREEFLAMTIKAIRPAEDIPALLNSVANTPDGLNVAGAWKHRKKSGTVIDVEVTSHTIDFAGRQAEIILANDITERRGAEESLRAKSEELAALMQQLWQTSRLAVMGELAASVAHELNNPLATISLRTESLLAQVAEDDARRRPLEIIDLEVERMGSLVSNLLQFSRRSHQQISTMDVREEVVNTLEFIHYHLRKHRINVECEFADAVPTVQADRQQMRQLFLNLLTNASDAMPQGGRLTVRVSAGQSEHGAHTVAIEFEDTGAGIAPDDLPKVWEPFFTTKPEGKGTGLGLAICRRIVEEHGGTMHIESEVGRGTTARIVLPATNGKER